MIDLVKKCKCGEQMALRPVEVEGAYYVGYDCKDCGAVEKAIDIAYTNWDACMDAVVVEVCAHNTTNDPMLAQIIKQVTSAMRAAKTLTEEQPCLH